MKIKALIPAAVMIFALAGNVSALENDLQLNVTPKSDSVKVGERIEVDISAENGGDPLTDFRLYFEDQEIYADDVLESGETAEKEISLLAWERDIASGGAISISADANELEEPVAVTVHVTVLPGIEPGTEPEGNPATGDKSPLGAALALTAASGTLILIKRK
ncbi:MAG: hypothetical protein IJ149_06475 [Oscillospiraceae bacterium]|nr:hypothetical protein [Oscillospiraceae bacterium]